MEISKAMKNCFKFEAVSGDFPLLSPTELQRKIGPAATTNARTKVSLVNCKHECCKLSKHAMQVIVTCTHRDGIARDHLIILEAEGDIGATSTVEISGIIANWTF